MENINSGSADVDEAVQQVNHYCHASAKEVGIQKNLPENLVMEVLRKIEVEVCVCPR